jgi:hypothetical protein
MRFVAIFLFISFAVVAVLVQGNGQEGGSGNEGGRHGRGNWSDTCGVKSTLDTKCSIPEHTGPPDAAGRACIRCLMKECKSNLPDCDTFKACLETASTTC